MPRRGHGRELASVRKDLFERYEEVLRKLKNYSPHDLAADDFERRIWKILQQFGIDYPKEFDVPPPDVYVPARQGTFCLDPQGTTGGGSPPVPTDKQCLTWRARTRGFLVIDHLDFILEDPIAEGFKISYQFDQQANSAMFQQDNSIVEPGHWKFNRIILINEEVLTVCVSNPNPDAGGCVSFESRCWSL